MRSANFTLLSIGKRMPRWVTEGCDEYSKRLPGQWRFQLREFAQSRADTAELRMAAESKTLLDAIDQKSHVVALDNRGASWTTEQLSRQLQVWLETGKPLNFVIGGADGLHDDCRTRAEQLYRAHSLANNHPYHRAG